MDSIKFNVKGHNVVFSKRDLTIDGEVYKYTGISQVKHSSAYKAYLFRYNGEWVKLFYDEQHASAVAALFKRINAMNAKRLAKARATQSIDTAAIAAALAAAEEKEEKPEEKVEEPAPEAKAEEPAAKPAEEPKPEPIPVPIPPVEPVLELEPTPEPKTEEKPEAEAKPETPEEKPETPAEEPAETPAEEPKAELTEEEKAKKTKKKKAFIIFAIIIALFLVAGIIYFLTVGTTNDASQGPNIDETHQYNDIEELIEEMQE